MSIVYNCSEELVKDLKRTFKPFKSLIKDNTSRDQRFPFVQLKRCPKLDNCLIKYKSNDFKYNESIDRKLNKICKKFYRKATIDSDSGEELPPKKKRKVVETLLNLNLITNENEDLDFEEDNSNKANERNIFTQIKDKSEPNLTNGFKDKNSDKMNGFYHKNDYKKTNDTSNEDKNNFLTEINGFHSSVNNNPNFKIPKNGNNFETIISRAKSMATTTRRPAEAYTHLLRHLSEDQWSREDVMDVLVATATNMVANTEFATQVKQFNELIDKIKSLKYFDNHFWDQIIANVEKKKDSKNSHVRHIDHCYCFLII